MTSAAGIGRRSCAAAPKPWGKGSRGTGNLREMNGSLACLALQPPRGGKQRERRSLQGNVGTGFALVPKSLQAAMKSGNEVRQHDVPAKRRRNVTHLVWHGQ